LTFFISKLTREKEKKIEESL